MANTPFIQEFLFRGRDSSNPEPSDWHVIVGIMADDGFGNMRLTLSSTMSAEQAAEAGYALPDVISAINTEVLAELEQARAQIATLQAQLDQT